MNLTAAQHVSGMLTSRQSARRQAGFQTICQSKDLLAPDEVRVIEGQVQSTSSHKEAKWQSYRLNSRRHVISRIVPIAEPDEFGRWGRFFAHSLIFEVAGPDFDDFVFSLVDEKYFFNTLEALLGNEASKSGYMRSVAVQANTLWINQANRLAETWAGAELDRLFVLMAHTPRICAQGQFVGVGGSEQQILEALKVSALVVPTASRHLCSFDTNAERDPRSMIKFWGRGSSAPPSGSYIIDASRLTVASPLPLFSFESFSLEKLSGSLSEVVAGNLKRTQERLSNRDLFNRPYPEFLGQEVYEALCVRPDLAITESDLKCLEPLRRSHLKLNTLLALRSGDQSLKLSLLRQFDSGSYRTFIGDVTKYGRFNPSEFFSTRFVPMWLEFWRGQISLEDVWFSLETVEQFGSKEDRKETGLVANYLSRQQLDTLEQWLEKSKLRFKELHRAIIKSREANQAAGLFSTPKAWLRRFTSPRK